MSKKYQRGLWPKDTADRIKAARDLGIAWETIASDFGVCLATLRRKSIELGYAAKEVRRFTPEEDVILRADWLGNVDLNETAAKLGRSFGVIRQRLFHHHRDILNGPRTAQGTRSLKRYGRDLLNHGTDLNEAARVVRQKVIEAKAAARVAAINAKNARRDSLIAQMLEQIAAGKSRDEAIFETRCYGVELQRIADHFGITRERVRQICDEVAFKKALAGLAPETPKLTVVQGAAA